MSVAGEHLVAEWKPVEADHPRDADLLAVGSVVARIAALGQRIRLGLAFEIGTGHVVEQHVVLDGAQFAAAPRQMRLERGLVPQQVVERAVQPVLVDLGGVELHQVGQRRAAVPILADVQFARWLAQPGRHQHRGHLRPRHALLAHRQQPLAQIFEAGPAPQRQRQIHVAELPRTLDPQPLQAHRHRQIVAAVVEEPCLFRRPNQAPCKRPRSQPAVLIEFATARHSLLNDAATDPHAAHKGPITVDLPILPTNRVAQIHAPHQTPTKSRKKTQGRHYTPKPPAPRLQLVDSIQSPNPKIVRTTPQLRKVG